MMHFCVIKRDGKKHPHSVWIIEKHIHTIVYLFLILQHFSLKHAVGFENSKEMKHNNTPVSQKRMQEKRLEFMYDVLFFMLLARV